MMYAVLEMQKTGETLSVITTTFEDRQTAESKFHQVLQYAAVSNVSVHSAVIMSEDGSLLKRESYRHIVVESEVEE